MKKENLYVIKTINMYEYLCKKKIYPVDTRRNIHIPQYIVWRYENTPQLHLAMQQYKKEK